MHAHKSRARQRSRRISGSGTANDGSRYNCGNRPGAGSAASPGVGTTAGPGPGADSPLAGARRTAMQPARRRGAPRRTRKSCGCNCCGVTIALIVATMRPSRLGAARCGPRPRLRRWRRTAGPCPALCKAMTAQLWPTRPSERALLELEDIAGTVPFHPPEREMQRASKTVRTNQPAWPGRQGSKLLI